MSLVYPVLMSYAVELFPERSGFASGIMAAGFGSGAIIWAPLAMSIYTRNGNISTSFLYLGVLFLIVMIPLSLVLKNAPGGFREDMLKSKSTTTAVLRVSLHDVNRRGMIRLPFFYIAFVGLTCALSSGNMMVSQGSPIVRNIFAMTVENAALVVSVMSVFNVIGRIACGAFSDQLGKNRSILLLSSVTAVMMLCMVFLRNQALFILCMLFVVFSYGGMSSLVAPVTAELFGDRHVSENYSIMYCVYAMGSLTGPMLGAAILSQTGSYPLEFAFGCALSLIAVCVMLYIVRRLKQKTSYKEKDHEPIGMREAST